MNITGHTRVFALVGHPVHHSLSPQLHNRWLAEFGVDGVYVALEAAAGADVGAALRALRLAGANLTVPFKEAVLPHLDAVDGAARRAGAVNVVVREGDRLIGYNTDGEGFMEALGLDVHGARVTVIGAGGSAGAIGAALLDRGAAAVTLTNRTFDRAVAVASRLGARAAPLDDLPSLLRDTDLLVQTAGGDGARLTWSLDPMPADATVVDINYWHPGPLLEAARARGLRAVDGLGMLVHQAAAAFVRFTGHRPDAPATLARLRGGELRPT